jgi:methanogenic corrinoid protein MtbC1
MSAILTTTSPKIKDSIGALNQAGLRNKVNIAVGEAPLANSCAKKIGADGFALDASRTVYKVQPLLRK